MTVGMFVSSSVRTGVRHLVVEISVMTRHVTPSGGLCGAEEMRGLAVGGDVVEPQAIRATTTFFVLVLGQGVILRIFAIPENGAMCPSSQA
jgi:hypothetical protein